MEIWKDIKENDYYQVSNLGRLKSKERRVPNARHGTVSVKERMLKPAIDGKGYFRAALSRDNKLKTYKVHRLVANAFIDNPEDKPQVNHINGIKTDNRVDNLEWVTNSENAIHAVNNGLWSYKRGHEHHRSKIDEDGVRLLIDMKNKGCKNQDIADYFNVSISCVKRTYKRGIK